MQDYKVIHLYVGGGGQYKVEAWGWTVDHGPEKELEGLSAENVAEVIMAPPKVKTIYLHDDKGNDLREAPADLREALRLRGGQINFGAAHCTLCGGTGLVDGAACPDCRIG